MIKRFTAIAVLTTAVLWLLAPIERDELMGSLLVAYAVGWAAAEVLK